MSLPERERQRGRASNFRLAISVIHSCLQLPGRGKKATGILLLDKENPSVLSGKTLQTHAEQTITSSSYKGRCKFPSAFLTQVILTTTLQGGQ